MRLINLPFILIIKTYKFFLSPFFYNSCRFEPSCSSYALICFEKYNIFKAFYMTSIRILKCNPWFHSDRIDNPFEKEKK